MKSAVIYARYSSYKQNEMSIEGQIAECRRYAKDNDINIIGEYIDRAKSATTDHRPNFLRMVDDSGGGDFDTILVYQLDRFARNRNDSGYYKKILTDNGVKVISAKEYIPDDITGILTEGMLEIYADFFSKQHAQKVHRGMYQNAEKCKYNGGTLTFGYAVDQDGHYIPDEKTAPIVREVFRRVADHESIRAVIDDLNERGIRTSKGGKFTRNSFQWMLRNEKYIGTYTFGTTRIPKGMPQLVDYETFETVQAILGSRTHERRPAKEDFILTGKLYCGHCEKQMMGTSGTSKTGKIHKYYTCSNATNRKGTCTKKNVQKSLIEESVFNTCRQALNNETIEAIVDYVSKENEKDQESPELIRLRSEVNETELRIEKLLDQIESGNATARITERISAREQELESLQDALRQEIKKQRRIDPDVTREFLRHIKNERQLHNPKYKKLFIQVFVKKIYLYDDHFDIIWNVAEGTEDMSIDLESVGNQGIRSPCSQISENCVPKQGRRASVCFVLGCQKGREPERAGALSETIRWVIS